MEKRPQALLLKYPGTNCDVETARALEVVGFGATVVPIAAARKGHFVNAQLVVFPGGFSYGDYIMAGRLAQLETESRLGDAVKEFHTRGGYLLGICNGFQILTKLGILPVGSLVSNTSGRYTCRWAGLEKKADSPFLSRLPDEFEFPVAHAEGRFVGLKGAAESYLADGSAALTYTSDINGSQSQIAGLQDSTKRAFGLMPHPERFLFREHHYDPDWDGDPEWGWGHHFFQSIRDAV
ncbi:MAG: phosphoribosylformylglycinamidine synthase subunit PurQ [Verrucomicrobiota bacterium]